MNNYNTLTDIIQRCYNGAARPACRWMVNHTVAVKDGLELFPVHVTEAGE